MLLSKNAVKNFFSRQLIAALNSGNKAGAFFLHVDSSWKMLYNKDIKKERTTTMARRYRFLVEIFVRPYTSVDDTDGHNIYEEVIPGQDGFFRA